MKIFLFHYLTVIQYLMYIYFWYSTYYEYINSSNKPENLVANMNNKKKQSREMANTHKDESQKQKV